jgi:hypothetical protein
MVAWTVSPPEKCSRLLVSVSSRKAHACEPGIVQRCGRCCRARGRHAPSYWIPALTLLAPTLVLQLAAPTYLRTRLAPSPWTVAIGAVLLVWLAQVALPLVCLLVHARRARAPQTLDLRLVRLSLVIGTRVTLALAAAVVPGLWLQARYAFAPLLAAQGMSGAASGTLARSQRETHEARGRLLLVGSVALVVSALGQSAVAALAEAMGTITSGESPRYPLATERNSARALREIARISTSSCWACSGLWETSRWVSSVLSVIAERL